MILHESVKICEACHPVLRKMCPFLTGISQNFAGGTSARPLAKAAPAAEMYYAEGPGRVLDSVLGWFKIFQGIAATCCHHSESSDSLVWNHGFNKAKWRVQTAATPCKCLCWNNHITESESSLYTDTQFGWTFVNRLWIATVILLKSRLGIRPQPPVVQYLRRTRRISPPLK